MTQPQLSQDVFINTEELTNAEGPALQRLSGCQQEGQEGQEGPSTWMVITQLTGLHGYGRLLVASTFVRL